MDLNVKTDTFTPNEDHRWLGSRHGTDTAEPITLDRSAFTTAFPNGIIPSGVVVGKITATGKYAPYVNANSDGTETALGHLLTSVAYNTASDTDPQGALLWHGQVIVANLPTGHGLDTAGRTDLKLIHYIG